MQAKIAITWLNGDLKAKNKYTRASAIIVSYQWVICIIAKSFPEYSVVMPCTISWWPWCDILKSNGDFLSLKVNTYNSPKKTPGR